jgi:myo-inositol-1(or 4)-monophosphatase
MPTRDPQSLRDLLDLAVAGARLSTAILKKHFGDISLQQADAKGTSDYVSSVDRESETAIREFLLKELPDSTFLGEEMGQSGGEGSYRWIVDPLDGTTNYLQGLSIFAVSVALEELQHDRKWGELIVGAVIHPMTGEIWTAVRGAGSQKGDRPIRVSPKTNMAQCLMATGFPFRAKEELKDYLKTFELMFMSCSGIRRAGAAALDLCWTADGTFDGFWEHRLSPWDVAAGALIIEEAGGLFSSFSGRDDYLTTGNVVGANPAIHAQMLEIIRATLGSKYP